MSACETVILDTVYTRWKVMGNFIYFSCLCYSERERTRDGYTTHWVQSEPPLSLELGQLEQVQIFTL